MSPALVIGHPTTLVVSLLLIPVTLVLAVVLPGNQFLPLASLAGMFYVFVMVLPFTKGNVLRSFIVGLVVMVIGLYLVTYMHSQTLQRLLLMSTPRLKMRLSLCQRASLPARSTSAHLHLPM